MGWFILFDKEKDLDLLSKTSHKIINWDSSLPKNLQVNLSPTLPTVTVKKNGSGTYCTIIFVEQLKYLFKFPTSLSLNQSVNFFNNLTNFVNKLNPDVKSKLKFRVKENHGFNTAKKFSDLFGKSSVDKITYKNSFKKVILNSKLIIATYPQTAFSEAMFANVPTILLIDKMHYEFSQESLNIFHILKKNQIAFDDFELAKKHINKHWQSIDIWWKEDNVQSARKMFLKSFFNVKSNWYREWSDYIYSAKEF
jgi:hypothetical protein